MSRSLWQTAWRLLLAISLAVGPWPPAAWAVVAPLDDSMQDADAMPCHEAEANVAPADEAPCDDGCCPDPGCDPAHCLVIHPAIERITALSVAAQPLPRLSPTTDATGLTGPPPIAPLRPPIEGF